MAQTMKVTITLSVEVDVEQWMESYGTAEKLSQVRQDVKSYVTECVTGSGAASEGAIEDVTLR